jgi:endonuclease III
LVRNVCSKLEKMYDRPRLGNPDDPLDDLVYVLLSNKSAPERARQAYDRLKSDFAGWEGVAATPESEIVAVLRPTGFANKRARQLQLALQRLKDDFGRYSLDDLKVWPESEVFEYLTSLNGVSDKVARCVMMYTLGFEVLPVDAHVHRVAHRLGWTNQERPENSHEELEALVPPNLRYAFHVDCVAHSRALCRAAQPICEPCSLKAYCNFYKASRP